MDHYLPDRGVKHLDALLLFGHECVCMAAYYAAHGRRADLNTCQYWVNIISTVDTGRHPLDIYIYYVDCMIGTRGASDRWQINVMILISTVVAK